MENLQSCQLGGGSERLASEGKAQDKATELYTTPTHYCTLVMWEMSPFVPVLVLTWRSERKPKKRCRESHPGILLNLKKCPTGSPYVSHSSTHFCTISACHPPHLSTLMFCCVLTIFSLYLLFQLAWIAFLRSEHRNIRTHFHNWTLHWVSNNYCYCYCNCLPICNKMC